MANKKRLIDVNVVYEMGHRTPFHIGIADLCDLKELLEDVPTVDAVEVVHAEWSIIEDDYCGLTALQCSECNQEYWFEDEPPMKIYNYCPNCGAKMDGGNKNADYYETLRPIDKKAIQKAVRKIILDGCENITEKVYRALCIKERNSKNESESGT